MEELSGDGGEPRRLGRAGQLGRRVDEDPEVAAEPAHRFDHRPPYRIVVRRVGGDADDASAGQG